MKKTLVSALTTALVIGAASTTFAAANPFEDVPADHWAYDAIAQLAADGVIEGYGDGTYRGDQEITRYEMAQMVARAMAKGGGDKALIDKLAAEFADELNNLGVRVAALEKKVDNVKWMGQVTYIYSTSQHNNEPHENEQFVRLRLEPEMTINKNWTGHARLEYRSSMNRADNAPGGNDDETGFTVERMWVQGDYDNFQLMLGKLPYVSFIDNGMFFDDNISGGQLTVGSKIKGTVTVGRTDNLDDFNWTPVDASTTASYAGVELYNDREDKITWGLGYHHVQNKKIFHDFYESEDKDAMNIWEVGLGWQFTDNFNLNGAYAWNTTVDEAAHNNDLRDSKHAWNIELDYKGADETDKGSWGAYVAYRKLGKAAVLAPTYDAMERGQKGWELGFDYVPMKNLMASFKYFRGKDMNANGVGDDGNAQKFYTEWNFFF
ncbi:MAG: S-layer homology domain-containing protein [Schwartzia sp.]|nr:S-layer homology domain-containing protein [Schwartzia sp. (in: firmicutes)]